MIGWGSSGFKGFFCWKTNPVDKTHQEFSPSKAAAIFDGSKGSWGGFRFPFLGVEPKIGVVNPPKWMVKIMEKPINMDDFGGPLLFLETPIYIFEKT